MTNPYVFKVEVPGLVIPLENTAVAFVTRNNHILYPGWGFWVGILEGEPVMWFGKRAKPEKIKEGELIGIHYHGFAVSDSKTGYQKTEEDPNLGNRLFGYEVYEVDESDDEDDEDDY